MNAQDIEQMIQKGLPGAEVSVAGEDGSHFEATVVYEGFAGKPPLACHRMVYATLGDSVESGALHALALKTRAPEQA